MSEAKGDHGQQSIGALAAFATSPPTSLAEKPQMRSVAVKRTPELQLPPPSFATFSKPSPLGLSRPATISARGPSKSDSLKIQQTWTGITAPCAWQVKGEDLELVPMDYPLERTHRTIEGVEAAVVAKRISDALRSHSIEAKFVSKPVKAKCKTDDLVSFRIRLYAAGENGLPVVVEVQRRAGSASSFMKSCRAILAAAEGQGANEEPSRTRLPTYSKPIDSMKCLASVPLPPLSIAEVSKDEMSRVVTLIRSTHKDSNALGLENLLALTDPTKTMHGVALTISKSILSGDEIYDIRDDIRAFADRDVFDGEAEEEEALLKHMDRVRYLSLSVFANCLTICSLERCLESVLEEQRWYRDQFISPLVDELRLCSSNACCAIQACRCIRSLLESSASTRSFLISCGVQQVLEEAHAYGKNYNDLLAEETTRCLKLLNV